MEEFAPTVPHRVTVIPPVALAVALAVVVKVQGTFTTLVLVLVLTAQPTQAVAAVVVLPALGVEPTFLISAPTAVLAARE